MVDSRPKFSDLEIENLVKELNAASRHLRKLSRAQMQAAQAAEPLADSLSRIAAAADAVGMARVGVLADAGREALNSFEASKTGFNMPSLERSIGRMRQVARDFRAGVPAPFGFVARRLDEVPAITPRSYVPVTDENLLAARDEMNAARGKALEAANLTPMNALALKVQRLAAIAQDERARTSDLSPLSSAWLAVPVLSAQLARDFGKQIRVEVMGEEIFVERRLIPVLAACIEQLVRSAAEHSLELAARRGLSRKPSAGTITIIPSCDQMGLSLTITDDGNGERDASSLEFVGSYISSLGGGVEVVSVPDWGGSVTLAIPAVALGAWRLQVTPRGAKSQRQLNAASMAGAIASYSARI